MRRYWLPASTINNDEIVISGDPFHHIFDVCRQEQGSKFEILLGDGKARFVEVIKLEKKKALAQIRETREIPALPTPHLHLAMAISKYATIEAVIEKAVELGVHTIHPFYSEYSFIRKASSFPEGKLDRWQKIVISATQQTGRGELLQIEKPVEMSEILKRFNRNPQNLGLFAYEGVSETRVDRYLKPLSANSQKANQSELWLFVGGEGGFSQTEVQEFRQVGLKSVSLGEQVLRVETACITLLSILKYEFELF